MSRRRRDMQTIEHWVARARDLERDGRDARGVHFLIRFAVELGGPAWS